MRFQVRRHALPGFGEKKFIPDEPLKMLVMKGSRPPRALRDKVTKGGRAIHDGSRLQDSRMPAPPGLVQEQCVRYDHDYR